MRNIVKLLFVISLNQAGGSSTTASPLPTKTLAIGADTRPDQSGVPALIFTAMAWGQAKNPAMIHFLRFARLPQSGIYLIFIYHISSSWQRAKPRTLNVDMVRVEMLVLHGLGIDYSIFLEP